MPYQCTQNYAQLKDKNKLSKDFKYVKKKGGRGEHLKWLSGEEEQLKEKYT